MQVQINGYAGTIEGMYTPSKDSNMPTALILHSDPRKGSNMNNSVVCSLFNAFADNGCSTLKINFREVGKYISTLEDDELLDASSAIDWLQTRNSQSRGVWVVGFSFGGWVAMQLLMRRPEIAGFIVISLPINKYDFSFLCPCPPVPGLIIQSANDNTVSHQEMLKFVTQISKVHIKNRIEYKVLPNTDHTFCEDRDLDVLETIILEYLKRIVNSVQHGNDKLKKTDRKKFLNK